MVGGWSFGTSNTLGYSCLGALRPRIHGIASDCYTIRLRAMHTLKKSNSLNPGTDHIGTLAVQDEENFFQ